MDAELNGDARGAGPIQRVTAMASLVATLDRRIVDLFDTLEQLRSATPGLSQLSDEGADLIAYLRSRMDRIEAKLRIDADEVKNALLAKLDGIDLQGLAIRMNRVEQAVFNIEAAVTRLDRLAGGMVESAPDFIARRVKSNAGEPDEEPG